MTLDMSEIITKIKKIEKAFNETEDPIKCYALIQALNHIGEEEIPIHDWMEARYYDAMLKVLGEGE